MLTFANRAAHWVGRHALPAVVATAIAIGAAGGGIGYAVASQRTTATTATAAASTSPSQSAATHKPAGARAAMLVQRVLQLIATDTGQTVASVRAQLEAGMSVDQIAGAKAPAIEASILAQVTKLADRAVASGRITAAQETAGLAAAKTKIEALMAEPGTQLIKDAHRALQFLHAHGARRGAAAPSAAPATSAPTAAA